MAMTSYLTVEGTDQGVMKGDCQQAGREETILVYGMDHRVEIPTDTHTGLPTGQRIHKPLTITKHKDLATPLLYQACCTGEHMKSFELQFWKIGDDGTEQNYFTITLEDAIIVEMREFTPLTFLEANKPYHDMEEVSFTYSKITWKHTDPATESEDDWKSPKA